MAPGDQHRVLADEADPRALGASAVDVLVRVDEHAVVAAEPPSEGIQAPLQVGVVVAPCVPRQSSLPRARLRPGDVVAERGRDDGASTFDQRLWMAGDLGSRHREAHRSEQAARPPLVDVAFGLHIGRRRRGTDDVEAELVPEPAQLFGGHARIVPCSPLGSTRTVARRCSGSSDVPDPVAGPGQVLVRLRAASLNHLDIWVRKGLPSVPKPRILGADGAGVVEALGEGVDGLETGQRVVLNPGMEHGDVITVIGEHSDGTHAELIAVADAQVFPLDDSLTFEAAAAFPLVYETAYRMLVTRAAVQEGEWALIWGIGGGVATAAFEICRALGVRTIVTSGDDDKLAQAVEWGADVGVNHAKADVVGAVRESTGKGVDVVVESVGEATWARSLAAVRPTGRIVVCGATSGPNPPAQLHRFWWKQLTVLGSSMGTRDDFLAAYDLVRTGRVGVHVDRVFPLSEIRAAHERLEAGEQLGKIVLSIPG